MNNKQREHAESSAEVDLMIRRVLPELTNMELITLWLTYGIGLGNNEVAERLHVSKQRAFQYRRNIGAKMIRLGVADPKYSNTSGKHNGKFTASDGADPADRLEQEIENE